MSSASGYPLHVCAAFVSTRRFLTDLTSFPSSSVAPALGHHSLQHAVSWHGDPDAPCTIYLYDSGLRGLASRCRVYARGLRPVADRRVANRRDTNGASVYDAKGNYRDEEHHGLHRVLVALRLRGPWQGAMGPTDERTHVPASAAGIPSGRDGREGVIRIGRAFGPDVPTPAPDPERRVRLRWQPAKGTAP